MVEKVLFEKNDILGQNLGQTEVIKVCQIINCSPQSPTSSKYFFSTGKCLRGSRKKVGELQGITLVHIIWFKLRKLAKIRYKDQVETTPLSQRQNSVNEYFSKIDFADTLQRGCLDQNNQTYLLLFSKFDILPV